MRDLAIAYGASRQAKKWSNKTIPFDDLKDRLRHTLRTPESAEEYARMGKAGPGPGEGPRRLCGRRDLRWPA